MMFLTLFCECCQNYFNIEFWTFSYFSRIRTEPSNPLFQSSIVSYRILFNYRVQWINYYICTNELYPFLLLWFKQRIDRDKVLVTKSSRTLVLISPQIGLWWQCFGVFISACLIHGLDFFRLMLSCRISVCNCLLQMKEKISWINLYFSKSIVHLEVWRSFFSFF